MDIKEGLKNYIIELVKTKTNEKNPWFFIRWSGLSELCQIYGYDVIDLIDELASEKKIKKALIKGKLAISLPTYANKKVRSLKQEFEEFLKKFE